MCLIYIAHRIDPRYRLVVAANRDEFHARETLPANWWEDAPGVLAGRDLRAGGTWMGVSRSGRFAALTNFRDPLTHRDDAHSRGFLVSNFLKSTMGAMTYLEDVADEAGRYNGFSLLVHDGDALCFYSNRDGVPSSVAAGVHGLSNHLLDTPWPKVEEGKLDMLTVLSQGEPSPARFLSLLDQRQAVDDARLPDTGIGRERERERSSRFIQNARYGTRCSTVITFSHEGEVRFRERSFDVAGEAHGDEQHMFSITA
ncbi:MAG: hypothetical protein ACI9DC_002466 [Gammaproteobacteria bacterium]|jgi:uncharacterized protein with NRDE domain